MAVRPKPVKLICPQCGWHKIIAPKTDVVPDEYLLKSCPKCGVLLKRKIVRSFLTDILRCF